MIVKRALGPAASALLRHEEEILRNVEGPGVVRLLGVEAEGGLVLEDAGPQTLQRRIDAGPLSIGLFLDVAVELAAAVARLHGSRVIHGALAPSHVILAPDQRVTLVHFEDAATFGEARPREPSRLGRSLAWTAPEQTGRMNRPVDARSDLYGLGAIFYAMLTGAPPFRATEPLELVHAHLAQVPVAASIANPEVPRQLSDLVGKLLEKAPERRYQRADSLVRDLKAAREQWREKGAIECFELGHADLVSELPLPAKLYGRDAEREFLLQLYEEAAAGTVRPVLVEGEPGIGKTALVGELREAVLHRGGRFGAGKAAVRSSNVPYLLLAEALRALVRTLDGKEDIGQLRDAIAAAGSMVTELIPELRPLVGELPPVPELGPVEAEQRFRTAIQALVLFLAGDRTVVVFLDDLQWADEGSLAVMQALATDPRSRRLLLIGSVRPGEIGPEHPLHRAIRTLERICIPLHRLALGPVDQTAVVDFLADALHTAPERVRPLAELLFARTRGNPLFLRQLIRTLQRDGLLVLESEGWTWDLPRIERMEITGSVAALVADRIRQLPAAVQEAAQVAACIGPVIRRALLSDLLRIPPAAVEDRLRVLEEEGLLVSTETGGMRFLHDRVQQAAYESLPEAARRAYHQRIGRALLEEPGDEELFRAVDQLDLGADPAESEAQRLERARLNQRAGRGASKAAAPRSALAYFQIALELVAEIPAPPALRYELHLDAAEAAFLSGRPDLSERLAHDGLAHAASLVERAALQGWRIGSRAAEGKARAAMEIGAEALRSLFGIDLPSADLEEGTREQHRKIAELLAGRSPELLLRAPFDAPPDEEAFQLIVARMLPAAWFAGTGMHPYLAAMSVLRVLRTGLSRHAGVSLIAATMHLAGEGDYLSAQRLARAAVGVARRSRSGEAAARHIEAMVVVPWRRPYADAVAQSRRALQLGVETGELGESANAWLAIVVHSLLGGVELDKVLAEVDEGLAFLRRVGNENVTLFFVLATQLVRSLQGRTRRTGHFDDELFDETETEARLAAGDAPPAAFFYRTLRLLAAHLYRDFDEALAQSAEALPHLHAVAGFPIGTQVSFSTALALLARGPAADDWPRIEEARRLFVRSERACPENFAQRRLLLDAEIARVEGRALEAAALYDEAIERAREGDLLQDAALASELAGRHYLALGRKRIAGVYLADARSLYARWGAAGKVRALDEELGVDLLFESGAAPPCVGSLDVRSLLDAVETISGEIRLERLLQKLGEVCMRAAGAERGVLLLEEDGVPFVRAVGRAGGHVLLQHVPLAQSEAVSHAVVEEVRRRGTALVLDDVRQSSDFRDDPDLARLGVRSLLVFPLKRKEQLLGMLCFENSLATHAFTAERIRTLDLLAPELAVALENARLFQALQAEMEERTRAEKRIRFLADASEILAGSLDYEVTLDRLAHLVVPALADWCVIDLVEENTLRRVAGAHVDPASEPLLAELLRRYAPERDSEQPAARALRSGSPQLLPEIDDEQLRRVVRDDEHAALLRRLGLRSAMAVALSSRERIIGSMTFARAERSFDENDLALATELARRAALAIDNARLYRHSQEAVRLREEFLTAASHELKTPITSMTVAIGAQLRKSAGAGDESLQRALATADRGLKRLNQLVDQMLDVVQLGEGIELSKEEVDLAAVVADAVEAASERISRSGSRVDVDAGPAFGTWDRRRLGEVVASLLDNALKFGGGRPVRIEVEKTAEGARLAVRDQGQGIEPERLPHLFDRFERGVSIRHFGGLGLGLYLVRAIVEAHGGTVSVESAPGRGSTFTVLLPS